MSNREVIMAGFRAQVVERKLKQLPKAVLPAIIMLKSNRAAVLMPGGAGMNGGTGGAPGGRDDAC